MAQTLTLRYDNETHRVGQTYYGKTPGWGEKGGTTITTTQAERNARQQQYETAVESVPDSDYDPDSETPVPHLTYDPDTDSLGADVKIQPLPDS